MCNQCKSNESPEMKARLDQAEKLVQELEHLLVDIMIPCKTDMPPPLEDIKIRTAKFLSLSIDNVALLAAQRVKELWADEMAQLPEPPKKPIDPSLN